MEKKQEDSFAMILLKEQKEQNTRIVKSCVAIILVLVFVLLCNIGLFVYYISVHNHEHNTEIINNGADNNSCIGESCEN